MNELNYASLEASRRLVEAGIVLKTAFYWHLPPNGCAEVLFEAFVGHLVCTEKCELIPAPSMAEVWRELPNGTEIVRGMTTSAAWIIEDDFESESDNPTDALIDLLIWVRRPT